LYQFFSVKSVAKHLTLVLIYRGVSIRYERPIILDITAGTQGPLPYYYDSETGFYYLQSRYYDPIVKRFLNADSYGSTGQGFLFNRGTVL
jgi:hypothetical protein